MTRCRFDWFQMPQTVTLSIYTKNVLPESADIRCNGVSLALSFLYEAGSYHFEKSFNLFGVSVASMGSFSVFVKIVIWCRYSALT